MNNSTLHPRGLTAALPLTALCCGSLLLLPAPSGASLKIVGQSSHAALWRHIYDRLPDVWKSDAPILVQEVSEEALNRDASSHEDDSAAADDNKSDSSIDGVYEPGDTESGALPSIQLSSALKDEDAGLVFAHEYGHYVWDVKLTDNDRRTYQRIWRSVRRTGQLITEYAEEDPEEGFAESFAYFVQKPQTLRRSDPRSYAFLASLTAPPDPAPADAADGH